MRTVLQIQALWIILLLSLGFGIDTPKRIYTTARTPDAPILDGLIDESCWDLVEWAGDFLQHSPEEGPPPTEQSAFKILYDDANLYVAFRAFDSNSDQISELLTRRDHFPGDWMEIEIDSYFDHRTAYSFTASVSGVRGDEYVSEDGNSWDGSWDPVWEFKSRRDDLGWCAEVRIPLNQLRYSDKEEHVWGIQVLRRLYREDERSVWQRKHREDSGWVSRFGELHGIRGIKSQRQLELMPYLVGLNERTQADEDNPFTENSHSEFKVGLDGRMGIGSNFTLDFTINPDFGQVEADPSEINLSAFETFFREKRPFFIEGRNILNYRISPAAWGGNYSSDNLFYSRRIGSSPTCYNGIWNSYDFSDIPDFTTILGAFKFSGKTKNGLSIALLESITERETADLDLEGEQSREIVEPMTNYFIGRVRKEFNQGDILVGGVLTAVHREDMHETGLDTILHRRAVTGGLDYYQRWKDDTYYISADIVWSHVAGNRQAILKTQESSARYFQRPDADHIEVDPTRTELNGHGGLIKFGKSSGKHIEYQTGVTWRSPELELNDLGYLRKADEINQWTWLGFHIREPFSIYHSMSINLNQHLKWDFDGTRLFQVYNINSHFSLRNRWRFNNSVSYECDHYTMDFLRGGPIFLHPGGWSANLEVNSEHHRKFSGGLGGNRWWGNDDMSNHTSLWLWLDYRPVNSLSLHINPSFNFGDRLMQWMDAWDDDFTELPADDIPYVFGTLKQRTFDITLRMNYTMAPDLTLQLYAAPFISTGKYSHFKKITDPTADELDDRYLEFSNDQIFYNSADDQFEIDENQNGITDFIIGSGDYNSRSYHSNLVLRWEYRPGSIFYLVWSQGRSSWDSDGHFDLNDEMDALINTWPQNTFLVKWSYWFTPS